MSDDIISRSALKAVINEYIDEYSDLDNQGYHCEKWCAMKEAEMAIDNAPTVEPQKIVTIPPELIEKLASCVVDTIGNIDWDKAIEAYKAKPRGEWIPVGERLPDDLEPVNITWINHDPEPYYKEIKDKPFTATGVLFKGQWYWWSTLCTDILAEYQHNHNDIIDEAIEIIAWQPLPEPYKEAEDEQ